jgi:hypothetical protein
MENAGGSLLYAMEMILIQDTSTNVFLTKYGEIYNDSVLGSFDAAINNANVELKVTAANTTAYTVKATRIQQ